MVLKGRITRTVVIDNKAPFALGEAKLGKISLYTGTRIVIGSHKLTVTPYSKENAKGKKGNVRTINLSALPVLKLK